MNGNLENMQTLSGRIKSLAIDTTLTKKGMCAEAKSTGEALATKVNISDIVDDLTSVASDKPLSANQGRVLKKQIDEIDPHYAENVNYDDTNVKDALDKLNKDATDTQGAIDEISRTIGYTVSKNLLSLSNVTTVTGAEQVTVNGDNVSIKGTMTYQTYACNFGNFSLKKDTYTLSCVTNDYIGNGKKVGWRVCVDGTWLDISYSDTYTFELDSDSVVGVVYYSSVNSETSINTTCTISQPMLRKASEDDTYEPYVADLKTLVCNVEKIHVNKTIMSSTTNQGVWDYTATRKCLLNLTATAGHYGGRPVDLRAYVNGESFSWVRNHEASNDIGSTLTIPISLVMEKGESMFISVAYTNETENIIYVEGFVQYLE